MFDSFLRVRFLIDTGSDVSLLPRTFLNRINTKTEISPDFKLFAANNTEIKVLGSFDVSISIGLPKRFRWSFFVADCDHAIIGADFLNSFNLLVDIRRQRLIDATTLVSTKGTVESSQIPAVHIIFSNTAVTTILKDFPELTQPPNFCAPRRHNVQHAIPTTGPAVTSKPRRLRPDYQQRAKKDVQELVKLGIMRHSKSNWSSPVVIREKPDKSLRICGDYRALNSITEKDTYPMPNLADSTARLDGAMIFSTLDLVRAYYNIPVADEDRKKTALAFPFGLYEHIGMPFGLTNAPKTWQRFMDDLFRDIDFVFIYLDDIIIFSANETEHAKHLRIVLTRLAENGLRIGMPKCKFFQTAVEFLGHEVSPAGIAPTAKKLDLIEKLPYPKTIHELRSQLGILNFYRPFMKDAAKNLAPLCDLLKGHTRKRDRTPIVWNDKLRNAHRLAKESLINYVRLVHPRMDAPLRLTTDASDIAVGGVLEQANQNGEYEPIGFFSEKFTDTQQKWATFDQELHAIATGIEKFEHLLEGREFVVRTDHKPLVPLKPGTGKKRALDRRNRAIKYILQFNPTMEHIAGSANTVADSLSRIECSPISTSIQPISAADIATAQRADMEINFFLSEGYRSHSFRRVTIDGVTVVCTGPEDNPAPIIPKSLRKEIFSSLHNIAHPGRRATTRLIKRQFWWPKMESDIRIWCRTCLPCQKNKVTRHNFAPLQAFPPSRKFEQVHIDIVGPLPACSEFQYLCTMIDRWSRWPEAIPLTDIRAETIATAFVREWVSRYGPPRKLTCDRGSQFTSELFRSVNHLLGTSVIHTTAYHPQANGVLER